MMVRLLPSWIRYFCFAVAISTLEWGVGGAPIARAEFSPVLLDESMRQEVAFRLRRAGSIPHLAYRIPYGTISGDAQYEFIFPHLSEAEFRHLHLVYSGALPENSGERYQPNRVYRLQDFLPGGIRAVLGHRFENQDFPSAPLIRPLHRLYPRARFSYETGVTTNCWSTVYNVLRGSPSRWTVFYAAPAEVLRVFEDPRFSAPVRQIADAGILDEPYRAAGPALERNRGLRPMDFVYILGANREMAHAAIFIDDDLYFEKTGASSNDSYRFVPMGELRRLYSAAHRNYTFIYRRKIPRTRVPHPRFAFSANFRETRTLGPLGWRTVAERRYSRGADGRVVLEFYFHRIQDVRFGWNPDAERYELRGDAFEDQVFQ